MCLRFLGAPLGAEDRAHVLASIATASSGTTGMKIRDPSPLPTPSDRKPIANRHASSYRVEYLTARRSPGPPSQIDAALFSSSVVHAAEFPVRSSAAECIRRSSGEATVDPSRGRGRASAVRRRPRRRGPSADFSVDRLPDLLGGEGHVDVHDAVRREGVAHRVHVRL